ncbi:MAG: dipeptide epimerase, partial [Cyclobacteriaceae bacterium]
MTRIKDNKVWREDLDNTKPNTIANKTTDKEESGFVEITLDNGTTGIGAGNPSDYVTGETLDACMSALSEQNI